MLGNIRNKIKQIRDDLTRLDHQPIGKTVLIVVLFLDLFILNAIFSGLDDHTSQLVTPYETIPQHCRDILIEQDWNQDNRLPRLATIVSTYNQSYYYTQDKTAISDQHALCQPISTLLTVIKKDNTLSDSLSSYQRTRNQVRQVKTELERSQGAYDTSLLEQIADKDVAATQALDQQTSEQKQRLNQLIEQETAIKVLLLENQSIQQFFKLTQDSTRAVKTELISELRRLNFWYPLKRLAMEMAFLLPLIMLFYFWYSNSIKRNKPYQTLVSTHLLVVAFIPVIFKVMELVYDILPQKLLKHLIELLESFKLVAIWYYLMMVVGILAALALIYFLQKKIFSHQRLMNKRISKGQCQQCGVRLPANNEVCHACGFQQFRPCRHCHNPTYVHSEYCIVCGENQSQPQP